MKKNLILLNPSSGQSRALNLKEQLEQELINHKVDYEIILTKSEQHLRELIRYHLEPEQIQLLKSILTAGGDSTFAILINEMMHTGKNIPVGIIPMGSSDDIARELGIFSIDDAASAIVRGNFQKMDIGKITDERGFEYYFPGQANLGIGVFVNRFVADFQGSIKTNKFATDAFFKGKNARAQRHLDFNGKTWKNIFLIYSAPLRLCGFLFRHIFRKNQTIAGILAMYRAFQEKEVPAKFTISYENNSQKGKPIMIKDEFVSLLFSKIRFWATGRLFLPESKINDGKIHLMMIRKCGFLKTLLIMLRAANGKHIDGNVVKYVAASNFQLTAGEPFMIQVDGDIIQDAGKGKVFQKISIEAIKDRIEILTS